MNARERWQERHQRRPPRAAASAFVAEQVARHARARRPARALDVACGSGRHVALLRAHGFDTVALDQSSAACRRVAAEIPGARAVVGDAGALPLRPESFALVVQTRFLDRAIFPDLLRLLAPNGLLVVETFLVAQHEATGHPRLDFCLAPGELRTLVTGAGVAVRVVSEHEGPVRTDGAVAHLAALAACKV